MRQALLRAPDALHQPSRRRKEVSVTSQHNLKNGTRTPGLLHVTAQRAVRGHQDVQAQVELPATDEERVADVERDHVGLLGGLRHEPGYRGKPESDRRQRPKPLPLLRWGGGDEVLPTEGPPPLRRGCGSGPWDPSGKRSWGGPS